MPIAGCITLLPLTHPRTIALPYYEERWKTKCREMSLPARNDAIPIGDDQNELKNARRLRAFLLLGERLNHFMWAKALIEYSVFADARIHKLCGNSLHETDGATKIKVSARTLG